MNGPRDVDQHECTRSEDMTTNGAPPPARVQLTRGSWVGIAGIAASVVIAMFAAVERSNARFSGMHTRFDGMGVRMDASHQELRAQIQAVDNRVYALVYDVSYLRGYLREARGDLLFSETHTAHRAAGVPDDVAREAAVEVG